MFNSYGKSYTPMQLPALNHRQLTERSQQLGDTYRQLVGQIAWGKQKGFSKEYFRVKEMRLNKLRQRMVRLVIVLSAQKKRQQDARASRNKKIAQEKLWLRKHGRMMFDQPYKPKFLGKRKRK